MNSIIYDVEFLGLYINSYTTDKISHRMYS